MKQYEKMGFDTEAALKWVDECKSRKCADCSARDHRPGAPAFCAVSYLLSDVPDPPKVPRWQTAKTQADFEKFKDAFYRFCIGQGYCAGCRFEKEIYALSCYHAYLLELVDAPESEVGE